MINKKNIVLMVLVVFLLSFIPVIGAEEDWWDDSFNKRREITISSSASLTDFPVYLDISYDSDMQNDYDDLRFIHGSCNSNQTLELDYEFVESDIDSAEVWIRIPELVSGTNSICMYYNNPEATAGENPTGVWDDNFVLVNHMNDNDASSVLDSTSYSNDGTKKGADEPIETTGKIYHAQDYNSSNLECINHGHDDEFDIANAITLEAWTKPASVMGSSGIFGKKYGPYELKHTNNHLYLELEDTTSKAYYARLYNWLDESKVGNWYYFTGTWDKNIDKGVLKLYIDGSEVSYNIQNSITDSLDIEATDSVIIGRLYKAYNGSLDEVRISNVARSDEWIDMAYQIVENQKSLVDFGDEEIIGVTKYPQFSNPTANETGINLNEYFCINIKVVDNTSAIDTVLAEIIHPITGEYIVTMSNSTSNCGGGGDVYEATIQGITAGTWSYSEVWANDTIGNSNYYDFTNININVVSDIDSCDGSKDIVLTSDMNCPNLIIDSNKNYDTNGYNLNVGGEVIVKGTLLGKSGNHSFGSLTIDTSGIYSASNKTTMITRESAGGMAFQNNGVLIHNNGNIIITTSDTLLDFTGISGNPYNLNIMPDNTATLITNLIVENELNVGKGELNTNNYNLTIQGIVRITQGGNITSQNSTIDIDGSLIISYATEPTLLFTAEVYKRYQGLTWDGTYFYWGTDSPANTIHKINFSGSEVDTFTGPEHNVGLDYRENRGTILAGSYSPTDSPPEEVWEINKTTGEKIRMWDFTNAIGGEKKGIQPLWRNGNEIYIVTKNSTKDMEIWEATIYDNGTFTLGDSWMREHYAVTQGVDYKDGYLWVLRTGILNKIELKDNGTMTILEEWRFSEYESEGLTFVNNSLYCGNSYQEIHEISLKPSVFSAPGASGSLHIGDDFRNQKGSNAFIHNSGSVFLDTVVPSQLYFDGATFYNLKIGRPSGSYYVSYEDFNVENDFILNKTMAYRGSLTLGTSSSQGTLSTSGSYFKFGSNAKIQGASSSYPAIITGTDLCWYKAGSGNSIYISNIDYQIDAVTGGVGVTVKATNMTMDAFTVSSGDVLNISAGKSTMSGILDVTGSLNVNNDASLTSSSILSQLGTVKIIKGSLNNFTITDMNNTRAWIYNSTDVQLNKWTTLPSSDSVNITGRAVNVSGFTTNGNINLRIYYNDSDISELDENDLKIYRYDGAEWIVEADTGVNTAENYVWAEGITDFSLFAIGSKSEEEDANEFVWTNIQGTGIWEDGRNWGRTLVTEYPKTNVDTAIFNATNISDCYTTTKIKIGNLYVDKNYAGSINISFSG